MMKTGTIDQTIFFNALPQDVFDLIINAEKHSYFTGAEALTSSEVNGTFSTYDGYCHGHNLELENAKKIVQAWHFAEDGWPDDHYSICIFIFEEENGGTRLTFNQTGIPLHKVNALESGWKEYYWEPMAAYLS